MLVSYALEVYELAVFLEYLNPTITRKVSSTVPNQLCYKTQICIFEKKKNSISGHFELPPYSQETLRSVYHIRNIDVFKLKQVNLCNVKCINRHFTHSIIRMQIQKKKLFFFLHQEKSDELLIHKKRA